MHTLVLACEPTGRCWSLGESVDDDFTVVAAGGTVIVISSVWSAAAAVDSLLAAEILNTKYQNLIVYDSLTVDI